MKNTFMVLLEVVGLMCLRVFVEGDSATYDQLKASAQSLGAAFQKVNFLRDMKSDFKEREGFIFLEWILQRLQIMIKKPLRKTSNRTLRMP
ncbi:MAG: squalene/phytoene synthase family protein [Saprospiraceae bacterium]